MSTVASWLDDNLKALFDVDDAIYKSLISDVDGIPEVSIIDPVDFNNGALAGMIEWIRQLSITLKDQLFLDTVTGAFLDLMVHFYIGIVRYESESDSDYVDRVRNFIIAPKCSPASIIYYCRPFSSQEPEILEMDDTAFSDVSYSDNYTSFQLDMTGDIENNHWVLAGIADSSSSAYSFILRLYNTASADIVKVVDLVNRWIAGGIDYEIQIVEV